VALIQIAVGYHKCANGHPGGERMLGLGVEKLAPFAPVAWGVDVEALRRRVAEDVTLLKDGKSLGSRPPEIVMRRASES